LAGSPSVFFRILDSQATPFFDDDYSFAKALITPKYKGSGPNFIINGKGTWKLEAKAADPKNPLPNDKAPEELPVSSGEVKICTRICDETVVETKFD